MSSLIAVFSAIVVVCPELLWANPSLSIEGAQDSHTPTARYSSVLEDTHDNNGYIIGTTLRQWNKAAMNGDANAQYNLGVALHNGEWVAKDDEAAVDWWMKAAEQGHAEAQFLLGLSYHKGEGTKRNDKDAVTWWRRAAEHGNADAQTSLGIAYRKGEGVNADNIQAAAWLGKAAEQGNRNAQLLLGLLYHSGEDIGVNHVLGQMWLNIAATSGDRLAVLSQKVNRTKMSSKEIAEAKQLSDKWIAGHVDGSSIEQ